MRSSSLKLEKKQLRAFAGRIARLVLPVEGAVDQRDALAWVAFGVLKDLKNEGSISDVNGVVAAASTADLPKNPGPVLFYKTSNGHSHAARVRDLILDDRVQVRGAAVDYFNRLVQLDGLLSANTLQVFEAQRAVIVSTIDTWRRAAIELADAIDQDWKLNVAGVRQCQQPSLAEAWSEYLMAALKPSLADLQSCAPKALSASAHIKAIDEALGELPDAQVPLSALLDRYCKCVGHLCLGGTRSFGAILDSRSKRKLSESDVDSLLVLANTENSDFCRYHVCEALLGKLDSLTDKQRHTVLEWFLEIVFAPEPIPGSREVSSSYVSNHLARYYVQYLELRVPSISGECVTALAWWLTKHLMASLADTPDQWHSFVEQLDATVAFPVRAGWEVIGPAVEPSLLRLLTLRAQPSPWAMALLSAVETREEFQLLVGWNDPSLREERLTTLASYWTQLCDVFLGGDAQLFRFARGVQPLLGWIVTSTLDDSGRLVIPGWPTPINWIEPDGLLTALTGLSEQLPHTQQWYSFMIHQHICSGSNDGSKLWEILSSDSWKKDIWARLDMEAAKILGRTLVEVAVLRREDWWPNVPHLFALLAEENAAHEQARSLFFELMLRACSRLNAGSALNRLLVGPSAHRFRSMTANVRGNLEQFLPHVGGWAAGRLRAAIIDLSK